MYQNFRKILEIKRKFLQNFEKVMRIFLRKCEYVSENLRKFCGQILSWGEGSHATRKPSAHCPVPVCQR